MIHIQFAKDLNFELPKFSELKGFPDHLRHLARMWTDSWYNPTERVCMMHNHVAESVLW